MLSSLKDATLRYEKARIRSEQEKTNPPPPLSARSTSILERRITLAANDLERLLDSATGKAILKLLAASSRRIPFGLDPDLRQPSLHYLDGEGCFRTLSRELGPHFEPREGEPLSVVSSPKNLIRAGVMGAKLNPDTIVKVWFMNEVKAIVSAAPCYKFH